MGSRRIGQNAGFEVTLTLVIEAGIFILIGLISFIEGVRLTRVEKIQPDPLGPEYYSIGLGAILVILGIMYIVSGVRKGPKKQKMETHPERQGENRAHKRTMVAMILVMVIYMVLINFIGYFLASVIFFFLINTVVGYRSWVANFATTIVMTVCYYLIFVKWMGMVFPQGVLRF